MSDQAVNELLDLVQVLDERIWRLASGSVMNWMRNFDPAHQAAALYLLSRFSFFGDPEVRELARSIYRDFYAYPILRKAREAGEDTQRAVNAALDATRFLPVGNPSDSSSLVLYMFRQVNNLARGLFVTPYQVFDRPENDWVVLREPHVAHYVFLDDFCGSGTQFKLFVKPFVEELRRVAAAEGRVVRISYFVMVGSAHGLEMAQRTTGLDEARAVMELDESYAAFGHHSRYRNGYQGDWGAVKRFCEDYGRKLYGSPLGFNDDQLLLGFSHNTPDNTLPIFWRELEAEASFQWQPIFRRYHKVYKGPTS
jgi:hypothetical protein